MGKKSEARGKTTCLLSFNNKGFYDNNLMQNKERKWVDSFQSNKEREQEIRTRLEIFKENSTLLTWLKNFSKGFSPFDQRTAQRLQDFQKKSEVLELILHLFY